MDSASSLVSNGGDTPLAVWIEPWCDELMLPRRATLGCALMDAPTNAPLPEIEMNADGVLVVWASALGRIIFTVDGIPQKTGSRDIALPGNLLAIPVKEFVGIAFGTSPEARPGGMVSRAPDPLGWWLKLRAMFRR